MSVIVTSGAAGSLGVVTKNILVYGAIAVPSGTSDYIMPIFVSVPIGYSLSLRQVRSVIQSGTEVTYEVLHNGSAPSGWTGLTVSTTAGSSTPTSVSMADGDTLQVVVTAVSGSPYNMTIELVLS